MKKFQLMAVVVFMSAIGMAYAGTKVSAPFADSDRQIGANCSAATTGCSLDGGFTCQLSDVYRQDPAPNKCSLKLTKRTTPAP